MTVLEHTVPFFLPIREAENDLLSSNAMVRYTNLIHDASTYATYIIITSFSWFVSQKFIDNVGDLLQAYVDRREQVHSYSM